MKNAKKFDSEYLKELRKGLPYGSQAQIAKRLNTTRQTVTNAMHGVVYRPDIIKEAVNILKQFKTEARELTKEIESVVKLSN